MDTEAHPPNQDEARRALEIARHSEAVARHPRLPRWYFPLMAVVLAAVMLAQMLTDQRIAVLAVAVVVLLVANRQAQASTGVVWDSTRLRGQVPFLVVVIGIVAATAATAALIDEPRVWILGAAAAAAAVLLTGLVYGRQGDGDD